MLYVMCSLSVGIHDRRFANLCAQNKDCNRHSYVQSAGAVSKLMKLLCFGLQCPFNGQTSRLGNRNVGGKHGIKVMQLMSKSYARRGDFHKKHIASKMREKYGRSECHCYD